MDLPRRWSRLLLVVVVVAVALLASMGVQQAEAAAPAWAPRRGLAYTMVVHARVRNTAAQAFVEAPGSLLACADEAGVISSTGLLKGPYGVWQFQLVCGANSVSRPGLSLLVYDAGLDCVYEVTSSLDFEANTVLGRINEPLIYNVSQTAADCAASTSALPSSSASTTVGSSTSSLIVGETPPLSTDQSTSNSVPSSASTADSSHSSSSGSSGSTSSSSPDVSHPSSVSISPPSSTSSSHSTVSTTTTTTTTNSSNAAVCRSDSDASLDRRHIGLIAGLAAMAVLVLVLIFALLIQRRRHQQEMQDRQLQGDGAKLLGTDDATFSRTATASGGLAALYELSQPQPATNHYFDPRPDPSYAFGHEADGDSVAPKGGSLTASMGLYDQPQRVVRISPSYDPEQDSDV